MQRLQEVNKQLLEKAKEAEQTVLEGATVAANEEIGRLKKENAQLKVEKQRAEKEGQGERKKVDYLERECQMFREKYEVLKENAKSFEQAAGALYESHYRLTEKLKNYVRSELLVE